MATQRFGQTPVTFAADSVGYRRVAIHAKLPELPNAGARVSRQQVGELADYIEQCISEAFANLQTIRSELTYESEAELARLEQLFNVVFLKAMKMRLGIA